MGDPCVVFVGNRSGNCAATSAFHDELREAAGPLQFAVGRPAGGEVVQDFGEERLRMEEEFLETIGREFALHWRMIAEDADRLNAIPRVVLPRALVALGLWCQHAAHEQRTHKARAEHEQRAN